MKKIIKIVINVLIVFIVLTGLISYFLLNSGAFLTKFNIISVSNTGLNFYVYFEKVKAATKYDIIVYDSSNTLIYKDTLTKNNTIISFDSLNNNELYNLVVIAYDEDGNSRSVEEKYSFLWNGLSFSNKNKVLMDNDSDFIVYFNGDYKEKNYKLSIKDGNRIIDTIEIKDDTYKINNEMFKDKKINYTLEIIDNSMVIDKIDIYNLMSPVSEVKIVNPNNGDMKDYDDIVLSFEGGDNATKYLFELYEGNNLIRKKEISSKKVVLSNNLFEKAATYVAKITASYEVYSDYTKYDEVEFTISSKETLKPVYVNYNYKSIKKGTKIKLLSPDENAIIYYTLDGSDPLVNGIKYEDEIVINNDVTIKTFAKEDKKNDSIVSTYDFKVNLKKQFKVYLSPSNQTNNLGISEVGYTNEEKEMNDVTNYIEKRLKEYGVITYRNDGYSGINRWTQDSTYLGVDLHLAIHSNASEEHSAYGIETWINDANSPTYSMARKIQDGLINIYYKNEDKDANRGVKYAQGALGEVNPLLTPCGILVEIAHHDYEEDALWIMKNKEQIGYNIADSILEYFQIK